MAGKANIIVGALVAAVAAAALAFALLPLLQADDAAQLRALVHDADGAIHELPLDADAELLVSTSLGENRVVVEGGAVYVAEADCSNQDCVHQGSIHAPGQQIICLPHKLWIEVVAAGQPAGQMDVNAAAGQGGAEDLDAVAR